jgi:PAS domain S-box-containing protein
LLSLPDRFEVLLVEDNPRDAFALRELLDTSFSIKFVITHVTNMAEAIRHMAVGRYDLVMLDLTLPDSSGLQTFEKAHSVADRVPIIIMTALDDEDLALRAVRGGAQDYLVKGTLTTDLVVRSMRYAIERKRSEDAVRQGRERMERLRNQYQNILRSTPNGICMVDAGWHVTYANHAMHQMLYPDERATEEVQGTHLSTFFCSGDDFRDYMRAVNQSVRRLGLDRRELELKRFDGSSVFCDVSATRLDPGDTAAGFVLTIIDITEKQQAQLQREALEQELRQSQKMEAIGMLAGGIAHDFNNILQIVIGQSELALMKMPETPPTVEELERITSAGKRGAALTRQLLAFSRRQELEPQPVNLGLLVSGLERMLQRLIGEDIDLATDAEGSLPYISADPGQMEQVILNLCVNARDAMQGGGRVTVETSEVTIDDGNRPHKRLADGHYVRLKVTDTGCGMTPEVQRRIFEPFYTTKDVGKGTGLGLSTVYGIVKQSGGDIFVTSAPGQGTTFEVFFPVCTKTADGNCESEAPAVEHERGSEVILLVEDESDVRMLMRMLLEEHGYTIVEASNGKEALLLSQHLDGPIDLVITDVVMPELGGPAMYAELQKNRPKTPVIFVSGYTDREVSTKDLSEHAALLHKPFTPEILMQKIREQLATRHAAPVSAVA